MEVGENSGLFDCSVTSVGVETVVATVFTCGGITTLVLVDRVKSSLGIIILVSHIRTWVTDKVDVFPGSWPKTKESLMTRTEILMKKKIEEFDSVCPKCRPGSAGLAENSPRVAEGEGIARNSWRTRNRKRNFTASTGCAR